MKKETATHQRLQSILAQEGCPICGLCQEAVNTFLDTLLWESSTDLNVHEMLSASLGFCGRHSRELLTFGGQRLAVAVVERASLLVAIRRLPDLAAATGEPAHARMRSPLRSPLRFCPWQARQAARVQPGKHSDLPCGIKPCPACVRESNEEVRGIEVLLAHLEEFSGPLLAAGGLCLPHFVQATTAAGDLDRQTLLAIEQHVWTNLAEHVEEFIRKHMDHHHAEPIGDRARLAVERTIAALTGEYPVR